MRGTQKRICSAPPTRSFSIRPFLRCSRAAANSETHSASKMRLYLKRMQENAKIRFFLPFKIEEDKLRMFIAPIIVKCKALYLQNPVIKGRGMILKSDWGGGGGGSEGGERRDKEARIIFIDFCFLIFLISPAPFLPHERRL